MTDNNEDIDSLRRVRVSFITKAVSHCFFFISGKVTSGDTGLMRRFLGERVCGDTYLSPTEPGWGGMLGDVEEEDAGKVEKEATDKAASSTCCSAPGSKQVPRGCHVVLRELRVQTSVLCGLCTVGHLPE